MVPVDLIFGLLGYVVLGSNGESVYLTIEERVEFVRKAVEMAGKDKLIIAGAGCECEWFILSYLPEICFGGVCHQVYIGPDKDILWA